jgi:hypothetical protein
MRRDIFSDEHEHFRAEFRRFVAAEIEPKVAGWNAAGTTDGSCAASRASSEPVRRRSTAAVAATSCSRR